IGDTSLGLVYESGPRAESTGCPGRSSASPSCQVFDAAEREGGPARLMAGAEPAAGVAVEVLVEEHQVAPGRIVGVAPVVGVHRPAAGGVGEEDRREATGEVARHLVQGREPAGAGGELDPEPVAVEV